MTENNLLKKEEIIMFQLRKLYQQYGYSQYKMGKFEDYDFYAKNKDFLVSDHIITFTDTNGKLMALKPDVTLSIIRNIEDSPGNIQKLFYNENVYRVSKNSNSFRELMQLGLECVGDIDDYSITEVLILAVKSLAAISDDFILSLSHMDLLSEILDVSDLSKNLYKKIGRCIETKNLHELDTLCTETRIDPSVHELLKALAGIHKEPKQAIDRLRQLLPDHPAVEQLETIISCLDACGLSGRLRIDLSLINDMNYYNGIIFRGYIQGVPDTVLSGGQYDKLMRRMKKRSMAVGFAVYMDVLDLLLEDSSHTVLDKLILYDETTDLNRLIGIVHDLNEKELSFMAVRSLPSRIKYRELIQLSDKEEIKQ